jgi:hypothetical protein
MDLELTPESHVAIDLRATGILKAVAHSPTLEARPEPMCLQFGEPWPETLDVPVKATFRVERIEPPPDIPPHDREKMRENLRGGEVLDMAHFPSVELDARYRGNLARGTLAGALVVRGKPRPIAMDVRVTREGEAFRVTGAWEGKLTDLGVRPYKALLGAIQLADWVRLRLEARFQSRRLPTHRA